MVLGGGAIGHRTAFGTCSSLRCHGTSLFRHTSSHLQATVATMPDVLVGAFLNEGFIQVIYIQYMLTYLQVHRNVRPVYTVGLKMRKVMKTRQRKCCSLASNKYFTTKIAMYSKTGNQITHRPIYQPLFEMQIRRIAPKVYTCLLAVISILKFVSSFISTIFLCVNRNQFPTIVSCVWPRINNSLLVCEAVTIHRLTVQILALTKFLYNCHPLPPDIVNRPSLPVLQPPAGSAPHPEQPYSLHHHAYDIKLENFFLEFICPRNDLNPQKQH
jgi:hypothetical protein